MKLTFDIPDDVFPRVVNAICAQQGYQENIVAEDGTSSPNPMTKNVFAKRFIIRVIMENVRRYEADLAAAQVTESTLRTAAIEKVDAEVVIS